MKQSFLYNIILLLGLNLLIKPLYIFGIDAQVQNVLGEETYGTYFGLLSLCFLFQVLLDPGLQSYNITTVSKDNSKVIQQFPSIILAKLLLAVIFAGIVYGVSILLAYSASQRHLLLWIMLLQIVVSMAMFIRSNLSALKAYRNDSLLSVLDKLLLIAGVGYLLYVLVDLESFTIFTWVKAQIIAAGITVVASLILLRKHIKSRSFQNAFSRIPTLLKSAFPYALVFLLMTLYSKMDGVMLERLLPDNGREAGIYAAAFRLYDAGNMFAFLFASLLLPMFSANLHNKDRIYQLSQAALRLLLPFAAITVLSCYFYGVEFIELIYHKKSAYYGNVLTLLMLGFFCVSLSYIYGTLITATKRLKWFNICFGIGIIINWSLNYYLIPHYQAIGAAFATVITQGFIILSQLVLAHKLTQITINTSLILRTFLFIGLSTIVFYTLRSYSGIYAWYIIMALSIIFSLIISFLVGLLRLDFASMFLDKNLQTKQ